MLAEFPEDLVDRIGNADAALDRDRTTPEGANLGAKAFGFVGAVVVVDDHVGARAPNCLLESGDEVAGFGAVAVTTYLMGMAPLVLLMLWAVTTGRTLSSSQQ